MTIKFLLTINGLVSDDPQKFPFNMHLTTTSTTYYVSHALNYAFNAMDLTSLLMQTVQEHAEQEWHFFSTGIQWTQIFRFPYSTPQWMWASPCITQEPQFWTALTQNKEGVYPASWQWAPSMCKVTKEFYSLILKSYLLTKWMPVWAKGNLEHIIGCLWVCNAP